MKFLRTCDIFWIGLNGLAIDVAFVTDGGKPRPPLSTVGTLKVEPSLIPGVDWKLNRVLKKYGGWYSVMEPTFEPTEALYEELRKIGYDRERFDRSRAYILNPTEYTRKALESWKKT